MALKDAVFSFISQDNLYRAALVFAIITVIILIMIYTYLYIKKKHFRTKSRLTEKLNEWIGELLTESDPDISVPQEVATLLQKPALRQFVTDSLINIKKNLSGSMGDNVIRLYEHLGLKDDSIKKFKSITWHKRAKGIYELYMMHQKASVPDILKYTNSQNDYVRMEAQTAIIGFEKFDGLIFLETLTYPLTEWQQLKLLEQLATLNDSSLPRLPIWLNSSNDYVAQFAIKLADIYQQMQVHNQIVALLLHSNEKIRYQAIKALGRIAMNNTPIILCEHYAHENDANKLEILIQLGVCGDERVIPFLVSKLNEADDVLKLEAARSAVEIDRKQASEQLEKVVQGDVTLQSIFGQIKFELAL